MFVALALLIWVALSFALAPLLGMMLRRCEVQEQRYSAGAMRSRAQHPASHAA
jgi:hypothetical protein